MAQVDRILTLVGSDAQAYIDALSQLRIKVFREWPYLYESNAEEEQEYLQAMLNSQEAILSLAMDGDNVVGATTALPLADEHAEFKKPFIDRAINPARGFYLAESVLLSDYRGQGIGHRFFDAREAHALQLHQSAIDAGTPEGRFDSMTFAAVIRDEDDPRRPAAYRALAPFWKKRSYTLQPDLVTNYAWHDIGETEKTAKPMQFWTRPLSDLLG